MGILFLPGRVGPPGLLPHKAVPAQVAPCGTGGPVDFLGQRWTEGQGRVALERGPHQSTMAHFPFLWEDFS